MRFSLSSVFVVALAALASAQSNSANSFNIPPSGLSFVAGTPAQISWTPTSSGTVTILLLQGDSRSLVGGTPIAKNIPNSGSVSWTPPSDLVKGGDYALEIIDDTNTNNVNYTPQFSIDSTNTVAKTATTAASTATTASTTTSDSTATTTSATETSSATGNSTSSATTLATKTTAVNTDSSSTSTSVPSAGAAAPVVKVSGGLVLLALGMLAL
ncbi:MAG: hypothetical protein M1840_003919 [Geoglossum simile]|nr:MAG: hypothetical protein M1840_003919 [Geoglossum simile]